MWLIALAVFAAGKWLTWRLARRSGVNASAGRTLGYLFAWPGMDAPAFLSKNQSGCPLPLSLAAHSHGITTTTQTSPRPDPDPWKLWSSAVLKTLSGTWLILFAARTATGRAPLLAGWLGMIGLVLFLHF